MITISEKWLDNFSGRGSVSGLCAYAHFYGIGLVFFVGACHQSSSVSYHDRNESPSVNVSNRSVVPWALDAGESPARADIYDTSWIPERTNQVEKACWRVLSATRMNSGMPALGPYGLPPFDWCSMGDYVILEISQERARRDCRLRDQASRRLEARLSSGGAVGVQFSVPLVCPLERVNFRRASTMLRTSREDLDRYVLEHGRAIRGCFRDVGTYRGGVGLFVRRLVLTMSSSGYVETVDIVPPPSPPVAECVLEVERGFRPRGSARVRSIVDYAFRFNDQPVEASRE